ncbi:lipoprotein-releasing ABC transporter permease subunit [Psychromonas sp. 14N.309.X.WAT.B.A12]|uniref:lipoprotein-releasing ABC transporter permease subunit n=1 Tax=Psychromonas sp. 14N.309.X.WAT.B.A12 TaxID=2998322 RepID=UPI0025AF54FD|nr:lipoprotein-releasing ABC transporter permease subunit [Psychromonas sp. 14N.309.X.WAT.B.A12]MDN2663168.1 lipoprotein-releasing ABC transporter permease subunit [Psychromonas sp. 14N.309.X.WAT.B.A12]
MFYPLSVFIGLRYTKSKRNNQFVSFVSLFSTGGIILGVLALITVLSVMNGFEAELKQRILGAIPQAKLTNQTNTITDWQQRIDQLPDDPLIVDVEPMINAEAILQSKVGLQGVKIEGVYPDKYASETVKSNIVVGSLDKLVASEYKIIIGDQLARMLGVTIGDKVRITSTRGVRYTPLGQVPSQRNFTVAGLFDVGSDVDKYLVLMHAQDAARLIRIQTDQVTDLRFYFTEPFAVESWTPPALQKDEMIIDWRSTHGELFAAVKMEKNMIWLLLCLIIAVAAFNILSSSVMVVTDKSAEVAILKTLGINANTINLIFIIQGAFSGIVGALIGTGLGLLLSTYINEIMSFLGLHLLANASGGTRLLPVVHEPVQIVSIMLGAMFLSLLATLYPAYRAGKVSPVEALRYE